MDVVPHLAFRGLTGTRDYTDNATRRKRKMRHPNAPYCHSCQYMEANKYPFENKTITVKIDGKNRRYRIKPNEKWCTNGVPFKVNGNHYRWWGFDRRCPLNPHTHTCEVCGQRMCTYDEMCCACRKSRENSERRI